MKQKTHLKYIDIKLGMNVIDERGKRGKIVLNDDIDNIKVSFGKGNCEYYSLRKNNLDGISKLYACD